MKAKRKKRFKRIFNPRKTFITLLAAFFTLFISWASTQTIIPTALPDSTHPIEFYSNQTQTDLQQVFVTAIGKAEKSVLLTIYTLTDPRIIRALREKGQEGIAVTVICDAKESKGVDRKLGPSVKCIKRHSNGIMHQKILVIDEMQVWIGSANMTTESMRSNGNLVMALESSFFAKMIHEKASHMNEDGTYRAVPSQKTIIGNQEIELWFLPDNKQAVERIKKLLQSAQKTIKIAMFTWTRYDLAQEVINASKRGVDVEVVLDRQSANGTSAKVASMLNKNGIPINLSKGGPLLHHKFAYIDNRILLNGSANWTKAAFTQNDDCFMILDNLKEDQKELLDRLWEIIKLESQHM